MENNQLKKRGKGNRPQKNGHKYDSVFKRRIAVMYYESNATIQEIARANNISHQNVSRWAEQFSSEIAEEMIIPPMTEKEKHEIAALQRQVEALKKKLEYEQMRTFALETLIDLAKTEMGVDVRKNFGTKQPKK